MGQYLGWCSDFIGEGLLKGLLKGLLGVLYYFGEKLIGLGFIFMDKFAVGGEEVREDRDIEVRFFNGSRAWDGCFFYFHLRGQGEKWIEVKFEHSIDLLRIGVEIFDRPDRGEMEWGCFKLIQSVTHFFPHLMGGGDHIELNQYSIALDEHIALMEFYGNVNYNLFFDNSLEWIDCCEASVVRAAIGSEAIPFSNYWFKFISNYLSGRIFHYNMEGGTVWKRYEDESEDDKEVLDLYSTFSGKRVTRRKAPIGVYMDIVAWNGYFGEGSIDYTYANIVTF